MLQNCIYRTNICNSIAAEYQIKSKIKLACKVSMRYTTLIPNGKCHEKYSGNWSSSNNGIKWKWRHAHSFKTFLFLSSILQHSKRTINYSIEACFSILGALLQLSNFFFKNPKAIAA